MGVKKLIDKVETLLILGHLIYIKGDIEEIIRR